MSPGPFSVLKLVCAVVLIVLFLHLLFNSTSVLSNPLGTVSTHQLQFVLLKTVLIVTTINNTVTFMFYRLLVLWQNLNRLGLQNTPTVSLQKRQEPHPISVLDMTLNNLMIRLQSWSVGECRVPLHCHCSQGHSDRSFSTR